MKLIRRYIFRIVTGVLIYGLLHISHADAIEEMYLFSPLDRFMLFYTVVIVLIVWGVIDACFELFSARKWKLTRTRYLLSAFVVLTLITLPLIAAASAISEYVIKPSMNYAVSNEAFYIEVTQGQIVCWLVIAARIIKINSIQTNQLEQDKALMNKELLQSKYQNLKNQINPHFLFNSFSVLQNLIETDSSKASVFLDKLSDMYRYILEQREEAMSSLERELEILQVYLYLLKTRHEDRLQVNVNISEDYHQSFVPTLSLQLLIENAVKHNRFSSSEPLIIDLFIEDDFLVVRNQLRKKGSMTHSTKIGLENIRNRYSLQTDQEVVIAEDADFFTVKLPILSGLRLV
jgi:LytS/YehU family sensor histidine kinase